MAGDSGNSSSYARFTVSLLSLFLLSIVAQAISVGMNTDVFAAPVPSATTRSLPGELKILPGLGEAPQMPWEESKIYIPFMSSPNPWDVFLGNWANEDPDTRGITRAQFAVVGDELTVHMWGRCGTTECDWGVETTPLADADDGALSIVWEWDFAIESQNITVSGGRLVVGAFTHFIDGSGREDQYNIWMFIRG